MLRELAPLPEDEALLGRDDEACELDEDEAPDGDGEVLASSSAEKLSVYCEGSGRVGFGAVLWRAVEAEMSELTLNTLEPFAIEQSLRFSKEWAKRPKTKLVNKINVLNGLSRNFPAALALAISARPARFAAQSCGKRDCFAGNAPILKKHFPALSASGLNSLVWKSREGVCQTA